MVRPEQARATWRKSGYSLRNGDCVEVADLGGRGAAIRDSKNPTGPVLTLEHAELRALVWAVGTGGPAR